MDNHCTVTSLGQGMVRKNDGGREGYSSSGSISAIVAFRFILNLNMSFLCKTQYFRFRLLQFFE
jgi:hypothetical protein